MDKRSNRDSHKIGFTNFEVSKRFLINITLARGSISVFKFLENSVAQINPISEYVVNKSNMITKKAVSLENNILCSVNKFPNIDFD
jgi:hypothetical protein